MILVWSREGPRHKDKRYTPEDKIRILHKQRVAKPSRKCAGKRTQSGGAFYRWKRGFGMMDISEAWRLN